MDGWSRFEEMGDDQQIAHLVVMHGMPAERAAALRAVPGYLRAVLTALHAIRHDADAVVRHRHADAQGS